MKIGRCTPLQKSHRVEARGSKGRKMCVKIPLASTRHHAYRSMPNSPPESPTLQPVEAPPPWEDFPDNTYDHNQGSFEPLQLPKTMASSCQFWIVIQTIAKHKNAESE